jgi:hypothetical protein
MTAGLFSLAGKTAFICVHRRLVGATQGDRRHLRDYAGPAVTRQKREPN